MLDQTLERARVLIFETPWSEECEHAMAVSRSEKLILDHRPSTVEEAQLILDVVRLNIQTGERTDGKDSGAIENLKLWLSGLGLSAQDGSAISQAIVG